ncbi:hypothetical protein [Pedobacter psychrophilus]|uniref:hypothetical protein n=1 Tax=Pedobacter psychrophilus TaxID=1826909 RepID=UPI0012FE7519|nr:hypothetical protein [Pedobacter psychrophilus]
MLNDNSSASNAISAQISKPLAYIAMTEDQIIEKILSKLSEHNGSPFFVADFVIHLLGDESAPYNTFVDRLESLNLARPTQPRHAMVITDHGRQVFTNGGWLKYLAEKKSEKFKADDKEALEAELTVSNIEANRLNKRNSKYNIWFSIINVIIGLLNLWLILKAVK